MFPDPHTQSLFQTWLTAQNVAVREIRKDALRAALKQLGADKVANCTPEQLVELKTALGISGDRPEAKPTTDVVQAAPHSEAPSIWSSDNGEEVDLVVRGIPGQAIYLDFRGYSVKVVA